MYFKLSDIIIASLFAFSIYLTFRSPKEHCVCGIKIPEGGEMCECGKYNHRMIIRREEEKNKGNSYDTFL